MERGSCWEALIFAQHHKLSNLVLLVDLNGLQGFGSTREVADLEPLADKFVAFGLPTTVVDGHDATAIFTALTEKPPRWSALARSWRKRKKAAACPSWKTAWNGITYR